MRRIHTDPSAFDAPSGIDPKHVFLDARAVMQRYGWGKTRGYQNLKDRSLVPPPAVTHPDRWRLDQLMAWEDHKFAAEERTPGEHHSERLADLLPQAKRPRRTSA